MGKISILVVLAVTLAACGDSGGGGTTEATVTSTTTPTTTTPEAGSACPAEPFTGTISRIVEAETSEGVHVVASRSDTELISAYAFDFGTGDTFTVYVGDHQIDEAGVGIDTLTAPPGGLLATIFIFSEVQLAPGTVVPFGFVPIVDTGGGATITGFGADDVVGSMTMIAVTDDRICFDITSNDPQQTIDGTVSAKIAG